MTQQASKLQLGDREYAFKRMNLATFKKHLEFMKTAARMAEQDKDAKVDNAAALDGLMEMAEIIHECIVRAEPTVTLEDVMERLDNGNINEAYTAVMSGSGFVASGGAKPAQVA